MSIERSKGSDVNDVVRALGSGSLAIVYDEAAGIGELVVNAAYASSSVINFMAREARGLICLALTGDRCDRLELHRIAPTPGDSSRTAFTVSIEAREGISTGISTADRAETVAAAIRDDARAHDLVRPGHVFPIRVRDGGVVERPAVAEVAVDLSREAGLVAASVTCHILDADGDVASLDGLLEYSRQHSIPLVQVGAVVEAFRARNRRTTRAGTWEVATSAGPFHAIAYVCHPEGDVFTAFAYGDIAERPVAFGVHTACKRTGLPHGEGCPCQRALDDAFQEIVRVGAGVVVEVTDRAWAAGPSGDTVGGPALVASLAAILDDLEIATITPLRSLAVPKELLTAGCAVAEPVRA